jgi:hypothetical protein
MSLKTHEIRIPFQSGIWISKIGDHSEFQMLFPWLRRQEIKMVIKNVPTFVVCIYMSGCILEARRIIRAECLREGLCVTIEPTQFLYTGGEETGFVVGFLNHPRFPRSPEEITIRARSLLLLLLSGTYQHSGLLVTPEKTEWFSMVFSAGKLDENS